MDGVSAAVSILALAGSAKTIYSVLQKYYDDVKEAKSDIQRLSNEILALHGILEKLAGLLNNSDAAKFSTLAFLFAPEGPAEQCAKQLREIKEQLDSHDGMGKSGWRALNWPFKKDKTDKTVVALDRYKTTFALALNADQAGLQLEALQRVNSLRLKFDAARVEDTQDRQQEKNHKIRAEVISWLYITDPSTNHDEQRRKHQPTTGTWFLCSAEMAHWTRAPNSLLWLHGTSGCGKTVLSSTIIEHIKDTHLSFGTKALAYYYFDFNDPKKQTATNFLSSIIAQLCSQTGYLPERARSLYLKCHEGRQRPLLQDLTGLLGWLHREFEDVYIVVDALDECAEAHGEREELLEMIEAIHAWDSKAVHLLATSRRELDIEAVVSPLLTRPAVAIQEEQVNADIKIHVECEVGVIARKKRWPGDLVAEVEAALVGGSNGMFRWVFCQLDALKSCLKPSLVRQKLKSLPRDLEETYSRILSNIHPDYHEDACTALRWLTFSERPLELDELVEALLIIPGREPPFSPDDRLSDPYNILQILPGLISVTEPTGLSRAASLGLDDDDFHAPSPPGKPQIRLAHASVKDYLLSPKTTQQTTAQFHTTPLTANQFITEACLVYILQYDTALTRTNTPADLRSWPLLDYACRYWYVHKRVFSSDEKTPTSPQAGADALLLRLLVSDSKTLDWLQIHRPDMTWARPFETDSEYDMGSALYYAACIGFRDAVRRLLDKGVDPNTEGGFYGSPLRAAAHCGHQMTCLLLLHRGARMEDVEVNGSAALWYAADGGHEGVVKALVQNGALIEAGGEGTGTAVYATASNRHVGVVRYLLSAGSDVNSATRFGKTALRGAAMNGDLEMIELLVEKGAQIERGDEQGQTPLLRAAVSGKEEAVRLLLERGANIEARDKRGQTAASWAAWHGQVAALRVLLDKGANMESKDGEGQTALHRAAAGGKELAVKILIERGADVRVEDEAWLTPYEWAQRHGHFGIADILTKAGGGEG